MEGLVEKVIRADLVRSDGGQARPNWMSWYEKVQETIDIRRRCAFTKSEFEDDIVLLQTWALSCAIGLFAGSVEIQYWVDSHIYAEMRSEDLAYMEMLVTDVALLRADAKTNISLFTKYRSPDQPDYTIPLRFDMILQKVMKDLKERHTPVVGGLPLWPSGKVYGLVAPEDVWSLWA